MTQKMKNEFRRYKLNNLRIPTGILQIIFSCVMMYGLYEPILVTLSSLLLAVMMAVAVAVRLRIKDSLKSSLPAAAYLVINVVILTNTLV